MAGYLTKKGGGDREKKGKKSFKSRSNWTRRWFQVQGTTLGYYEKQDMKKQARVCCPL